MKFFVTATVPCVPRRGKIILKILYPIKSRRWGRGGSRRGPCERGQVPLGGTANTKRRLVSAKDHIKKDSRSQCLYIHRPGTMSAFVPFSLPRRTIQCFLLLIFLPMLVFSFYPNSDLYQLSATCTCGLLLSFRWFVPVDDI